MIVISWQHLQFIVTCQNKVTLTIDMLHHEAAKPFGEHQSYLLPMYTCMSEQV